MYREVDGNEIASIVDAMAPAFVGKSRFQVIVAVLSLALQLHEPNIGPESLRTGIEDMCEWLANYTAKVPKEKLN